MARLLETYEEIDPSGRDLLQCGRHGHIVMQERHVEMEGLEGPVL